MDGIPTHVTSTDATRRLVCHACGERLPLGAATSASVQCCPRPKWHIHDTAQPCDWCRDPGPILRDAYAPPGVLYGISRSTEFGRALLARLCAEQPPGHGEPAA